MILEIDIWRAAQMIIRQHGDDAGHQADARAGEMIEKGDAAGGTIWRRIRQAVE